MWIPWVETLSILHIPSTSEDIRCESSLDFVMENELLPCLKRQNTEICRGMFGLFWVYLHLTIGTSPNGKFQYSQRRLVRGFEVDDKLATGWGREEIYGGIGTNGDMFKDLKKKKKQRIEKKENRLLKSFLLLINAAVIVCCWPFWFSLIVE